MKNSKEKSMSITMLSKEAEKILGNLCNDSWMGSNGRLEHFSFWVSRDTIQIMIQNGSSQIDHFHQHYIELCPRKMRAVFYEYCGLPEKRKIIEENLIARGYTVLERDIEWFNMTERERSYRERGLTSLIS